MTVDLLRSHFAALNTDNLIGLYTTSLGDECRWMVIDLDRHEASPTKSPPAMQRFALHVVDALTGFGFRPLLIDSNGRGGFHIFTFLTSRCPPR